MLVGNVNGRRGRAIGHRDAVSPPLSRPYLANHLGAVMGPVQLSELSQELKPASARGPDGRQFGAHWALAGKAGKDREMASLAGASKAWVPPTITAMAVCARRGIPLLSGERFGFGGAAVGILPRKGNGGRRHPQGPWSWGGPRPPELFQAHEVKRGPEAGGTAGGAGCEHPASYCGTPARAFSRPQFPEARNISNKSSRVGTPWHIGSQQVPA